MNELDNSLVNTRAKQCQNLAAYNTAYDSLSPSSPFINSITDICCVPNENREQDKKSPYFSGKRNSTINHNGVANMVDLPSKKITCRHIATAWVNNFTSTNGCPDYSDFRSLSSLQRIIGPQIEEQFSSWSNSSRCVLIGNDRWMRVIVEGFWEMEKTDKSLMSFLVNTGVHVLAVGLKLKKASNQNSYIIKLYDPNHTSAHQRVCVENIDELNQLTIEDWFDYTEIDDYDLFPNGVSLFMSQQESIFSARQVSVKINEIRARAISHCLNENFHNELDLLICKHAESFMALPTNEQLDLLDAKSDGFPALYDAFMRDHSEAMLVWGKLLSLSKLSTEQKATLLAAKKERGHPGLYVALYYGKPNAIRAFAKLMGTVKLSTEQRFGLLTSCVKGLIVAITDKHTDAIRAWGELVKAANLPPKLRIALLTAKPESDISCMEMDSAFENSDTLYAYSEIVQNMGISSEQQLELLSCPRALKNAFNNGKIKIIRDYENIIRKGEFSIVQRFKLLNVIILRESHHYAYKQDKADSCLYRLLKDIDDGKIPSDDAISLLQFKNQSGKNEIQRLIKYINCNELLKLYFSCLHTLLSQNYSTSISDAIAKILRSSKSGMPIYQSCFPILEKNEGFYRYLHGKDVDIITIFRNFLAILAGSCSESVYRNYVKKIIMEFN